MAMNAQFPDALHTPLSRRAALGACALTALGMSGCSQAHAPEPVQEAGSTSDEATDSEEEVEPEPDPSEWKEMELAPAPTLAVAFDNGLERSRTPADWRWHNGVLATNVAYENDVPSTADADVSFAAWQPRTGLRFDYLDRVLAADEEFESEPFVTASYGEDTTSWLVYRVRQAASGLDPESTHVYAQTLDFEDGTLGDRVELPDGSLPDNWSGDRVLYAASEENVCIPLYFYNDEASGTYIVALDNEGGMQTVNTDTDISLYDSYAAGTVCYKPDPNSMDTRPVVQDFDDGTILLEGLSRNESNELDSNAVVDGAFKLADGEYLCGTDSFDALTYWRQGADPVVLKDQLIALVPNADSAYGVGEYVEYAAQLHDGSVVMSLGEQVVHISAGPKLEAVLEHDRFVDLNARVCGVDAMTGDIYLTTTDEQVIMALDGSDAGRWTMLPWRDDADATMIEAVLYVEEIDDDTKRYVVTRGGAPKGGSSAA